MNQFLRYFFVIFCLCSSFKALAESISSASSAIHQSPSQLFPDSTLSSSDLFRGSKDSRNKCENDTILSGTYAIYWGCFDPPTLAHRDIIVQTIQKKGVDAVIVVINSFKNKTYQADISNRIKMLEMLLQDNREKVIYFIQDEDHKADYKQMKSQIKGKLYAIVGQDSYEKWAQHESDFSEYDEIIIILRFVPSSINPFTKPLAANISLMKIDQYLYDCSSAKVRTDLLTEERSSAFLSLNTLDYIKEHHLYAANHQKH